MESDAALFLGINEALSGPWSTLAFSWITHLGNGAVLALLILVPMFVFDRKRFRRHALPLVLAVAIGGGVVFVTKAAVGRPRPPAAYAATDRAVHVPCGCPEDRSFPSGHTQTAFGAAVYLSCLYPVGAPAFLLIAALVGLSRVALGVHYPADVLGGALVGSVLSLVTHHIVRKRTRRRDRD